MLRAMERRRPDCPICAATDEDPPDPLGVHRCRACAIEFRPPGRAPIRGVAATGKTVAEGKRERGIWIVALVFAVIVGVAIAAGDRKASSASSSVVDAALGIGVVPIDDPMGERALDFDIHLSQTTGDELFATGIIIATDRSPVEAITLQVTVRDASGAALVVHSATVACRRMQPDERCPWMIDAKLPAGASEIEYAASGRRVFLTVLPQLDLRSEHPNALDFDPVASTVSFEASSSSVFAAWATVTALNAEQRVLAVSETRWRDSLAPGRHSLRVSVPKTEADSYAVRIGGDLLVVPAPAAQ